MVRVVIFCLFYLDGLGGSPSDFCDLGGLATHTRKINFHR